MIARHSFDRACSYEINVTEILFLNNFGPVIVSLYQRIGEAFSAPNLFDEMSSRKLLLKDFVALLV